LLPLNQKRCAPDAQMPHLLISAVPAVYMHNLVLMIRVSAFNDNSS
jgi:hypothetical protein